MDFVDNLLFLTDGLRFVALVPLDPVYPHLHSFSFIELACDAEPGDRIDISIEITTGFQMSELCIENISDNLLYGFDLGQLTVGYTQRVVRLHRLLFAVNQQLSLLLVRKILGLQTSFSDHIKGMFSVYKDHKQDDRLNQSLNQFINYQICLFLTILLILNPWGYDIFHQYIVIMSKPFSIRSEPWVSFDKQSYSILTDDFVHEKLLTVKVSGFPSKGAINLKGQVTKKQNSYKTAGELKLWFPIWNNRAGHLYFRSKNDQFKVHYDDGLTQINNSTLHYYNLYGSYQSTNYFKNIVLKAGVNLLAKNQKLDNRVRVEFEENGEKRVSTGHKFSWAKNQWSVDVSQVFDWKNFAIIHSGLRVGFSKGDNDFFFRADNDTNRHFKNLNWKNPDSYFTKFAFDYVRKVDDLTKVGLETELTRHGVGKSSFVLQRSIPSRQVGIKARVSTDKSVALTYQSVLNNYGKWTVGFEVSDIGGTNRGRYGLQLDLNL